MKRAIFLTVCLLVASASYSQWTEQILPNKAFSSICFPSESIGYAIAYNSADSNSEIFKTTNGGNNWTICSNYTDILNSIYFTDINVGYAVGSNGAIAKTTNGGANWITQTSTTSNYLNSVCFIGNNGWAVGNNNSIQHTTNGGAKWTSQSVGSGSYNFNSIYFVNASIGYICGNDISNSIGCIFKTTNGGMNWTPQSTNSLDYLNSIYFIDANVGFAVGQNGSMLYTTNGGLNWFNKIICNPNLYSVCFVDSNNGYVVGDVGTILKTIDGGLNWLDETQSTYNTYILKSVYFASLDTIFCSGYNSSLTGVIMRNITTSTSINENKTNEFDNTKIYKSSPNFLTIEMSEKTSSTTIAIFNIGGQQIISQQATDAKTTLDISNLAKGVYIVKVADDNGLFEIKKIVKE